MEKVSILMMPYEDRLKKINMTEKVKVDVTFWVRHILGQTYIHVPEESY